MSEVAASAFAQSPELSDWLRVNEQIALIGGCYPGWSEAPAGELCARFEPPEAMRVRKLSLGEKQRLAIGLALAHQPDLLVFAATAESVFAQSREPPNIPPTRHSSHALADHAVFDDVARFARYSAQR